jgi:hypothetical protein
MAGGGSPRGASFKVEYLAEYEIKLDTASAKNVGTRMGSLVKEKENRAPFSLDSLFKARVAVFTRET